MSNSCIVTCAYFLHDCNTYLAFSTTITSPALLATQSRSSRCEHRENKFPGNILPLVLSVTENSKRACIKPCFVMLKTLGLADPLWNNYLMHLTSSIQTAETLDRYVPVLWPGPPATSVISLHHLVKRRWPSPVFSPSDWVSLCGVRRHPESIPYQ